ncbi:MAG: HAD family hydrolase [Acidithiobacillus sp.]
MNDALAVVFDLDGVLLNFERAWRECAEQVLRKQVRRISDKYPLLDRYGLSRHDCNRVWAEFHEDWWDRVPLYEHVPQILAELEDMGAEVWAVTNVDVRHRDARTISLGGLIPFARIFCLGENAPPQERRDMLRCIRAKAFVDDRIENLHAVTNEIPLAVHLNRGYLGMESPGDGITVIDDLRDFPEIVRGIQRGGGGAG